MDRATANLPSADLDRTAAFYTALGFVISFKNGGWMILERGTITLEFFPVVVDPRTTTGGACVRVDDLDSLYTGFSVIGQLPRFCRTTPGVLPIRETDGLRMFVLIDPDGNLLRCIDNLYRAAEADDGTN
jgi:catechol 2,3-dioxygenase-like lactoylglutathione lyase family enzyme